MTLETLITILTKTSQVINKFSLKVAQKHATYKPGLVCKYNIQEMELVKGSAHALVYETGLLIGHTHILFYFIFQLLVQKHKISTIKGVSFPILKGYQRSHSPVDNLIDPIPQT